MSVEAPPHAGGLSAGHEAAHDVPDGVFAVPTVTQHSWPPEQSLLCMQGSAEDPLGQAAAIAAQVPSTCPPDEARQHTCDPGQLGQSFVAVAGPLFPLPAAPLPTLSAPLPLPLPLLLPAPALPLPLPVLIPLLFPPPSLALVPGPVVVELPPQATASAAPIENTNLTVVLFIVASFRFT